MTLRSRIATEIDNRERAIQEYFEAVQMKKGLFDFLSKSILGKEKEKKSGSGSKPGTNTSAAGAT